MDRRQDDALFEVIDGIGWYTVDPDKPMKLCRRDPERREVVRRVSKQRMYYPNPGITASEQRSQVERRNHE